MQLLSGLMIKELSINVSRAFTKIKKVKVLKNYPSARLQSDIETMYKLISKLDVQMGLQKNSILLRNYESLQKQYDTFLLYLRKIHYFDYYTCTQFEN